MPQGRPQKKSEYGQQLAEKQKIRSAYNLRERQFKRYFEKGKDPESIFIMLERRLDSIVFRAGFAETQRMARQLVSHGHIFVNNRRVTIPSYQVRVGDEVSVRDSSQTKGMFEDYNLRMKNYEPPSWLTLNTKKMTATLKSLPNIQEQTQPFQFQTVVEFYSR